MKVLVMGGTMSNGLALVRALVRHGHAVSVLEQFDFGWEDPILAGPPR